jgi:hypothetical protein
MSPTSLSSTLVQAPAGVPLTVPPPGPLKSGAPPRVAAASAATPPLVVPAAIPASFVAEMLAPYRQNARYLKAAEITHVRAGAAGEAEGLVTGRGRFAIPQSCYIDDTGHFNAVEFNICYNQLAYVVFGHCIASGIMPRLLPTWDEKVKLSYTDYKRHQLPSMLIARLEARFLQQLRSDDFSGELTVERISAKGRACFCFTTIAFADAEGVKARGSVVLAFSPAGASTAA